MLIHVASFLILSYFNGAADVPQGQLKILHIRGFRIPLSMDSHFLSLTSFIVFVETYTTSLTIFNAIELKYNSVSAKGIESYLKHSELLHSARISDRRMRILSSELPGLAISMTNVSPILSKEINPIHLSTKFSPGVSQHEAIRLSD